MHRLLIGMAGLAGMLLLVSLANIIMNRAQLADASAQEQSSAKDQSDTASDPLADIGVAPAAVSSAPGPARK